VIANFDPGNCFAIVSSVSASRKPAAMVMFDLARTAELMLGT
jgi:hypothetical protein